MNPNLFGEIEPDVSTPEKRANLAERFGVPPFSVLDARQGYWQDRKRAWLALGIKSEIGRSGNSVPNGGDRPPEQDGVWTRTERKGALDVSKQVLNESGGLENNPAHKDLAAPSGHARPATKLGADGKTVRGDGHGRCFGQDSMRGEHVVGHAIPGGGTGKNSAWKFRTEDGYKTDAEDPEAQQCSGTSIFDPVLCELVYGWFCPPGGLILDPFAGGSVRGVVAARMGRRYIGIDLRGEQIAANEIQAAEICGAGLRPVWHTGDSRELIPAGEIEAPDMIFSCPPYGDLEVYSDDPRDLSTMEHFKFLEAYREIIAAAVARLCFNRFAVFVVGDYRDTAGAGCYRNFVAETTAAFARAGAKLYNEAILITAVGSLPLRVGKQFETGRKLGKTHQNVMVYVKGDPYKAAAAIGEYKGGNAA